eukprot:scaffold239137_cov31-Tisochrysis_lutea.AAC.1
MTRSRSALIVISLFGWGTQPLPLVRQSRGPKNLRNRANVATAQGTCRCPSTLLLCANNLMT